MTRGSTDGSLKSSGQAENGLVKPLPEEPDALIEHVRVCEGTGRQRPGLFGTINASSNIDAQPGSWPPVSVIIITKNRHADAVQAVESVLQDDYPSGLREVWVVEETSAPDPIVGNGVHYHVLPPENRGFAWARNSAVRLAAYELLVFVDDDCRVEPGWLKSLVAPLLERSEIVAVAGAVRVPPCGPVGECESILGFPGGGVKYLERAQGAVIPTATFSTCNCAVRKSVLQRAGGFDERYRRGGEDEYLSLAMARLGLIVYAPQAVVRHAPRDDWFRVFGWFVRRGQARWDALGKDGYACKALLTQALISPCIRLACLLGLAALLGLPLLPVLGVTLCAYLAVVGWRYRWARRYYPSLKTLLILPLVKTVMDLGMDFGIMKAWCEEGDRGSQSCGLH